MVSRLSISLYRSKYLTLYKWRTSTRSAFTGSFCSSVEMKSWDLEYLTLIGTLPSIGGSPLGCCPYKDNQHRRISRRRGQHALGLPRLARPGQDHREQQRSQARGDQGRRQRVV